MGAKHVRDWTAADLRMLVSALDEKSRNSEISPKHAENIWMTATKMISDAMRSKIAALVVRSDNPARDVEGPERGDSRAKQFVYPSELLRFIACEEIPLRWRRVVVLSVYLVLRARELRLLQWEDVNLEHGNVHVDHAFERRSRTVKGSEVEARAPLLV